MNIQIINPIEYPHWDDLLLTNPAANFFQTSAWAKVLFESYNYKPLYFTIIVDGRLSALIPVMEVKSFLTGKRGVSLPFTDECRPIAVDNDQFHTLTESLIEYGKKAGWKHIEVRGKHTGFDKSLAYTAYYSHILELVGNTEEIFSSFKSNVKRNIKKAQKENVQVTMSHTWEAMRVFCQLNFLTRKQHGLPPQPQSFFRKIFDYIIKQKKGIVVLAMHNEVTIAAAVYFHFANQAIYKYGASDRNHLNLRPNNLLMWEAVRWYCRNGFNKFNFGRTEPENLGLLQFKRGWGTKEEKIKYYKYDLRKDCFASKESGLKTSYNIFKYIPTPILRMAGCLLYRHVG